MVSLTGLGIAFGFLAFIADSATFCQQRRRKHIKRLGRGMASKLLRPVLGYHAFKRTLHMLAETTKKLFSVDEYHRMAEAGIIGPDDRVELIDGEIIKMSPIGHRHMVSVNLATKLFVAAFTGRAVVSIQNGLRLSNHTEPEPDLVLLKYRPDEYRGKRWTAEDALLVIEVSDTTLRYDRDIKLPRYAAAGVPEVWIENLESNEILVYRDLVDGSYLTSLTAGHGDTVSVAAFPETKFKVEDLLA